MMAQRKGGSSGKRMARSQRGHVPRKMLRLDEEEESSASSSPKVVKNGFLKGSIVRIRLKNFLTFDAVTLTPSPHLNVIVGPNGTGKSSIVCAVCLGLAGDPSLLGRAKELKDFVKHGKETGCVEIELSNPGGGNPVIRRELNAHDNKSIWRLNGNTSSLNEVKEVIKGMNIQLKNRCQFLPQDMVVEFAKMNKYTLLEETEKAVGMDLSETHSKLKLLGSDKVDFARQLEEKNQLLEEEEHRNQLLERDVARYRDRQKFIEAVKMLTTKKLWMEYEAAREEREATKKERHDATRELKLARRKYQPIKEKHSQQEEAVQHFKTTEMEKVRVQRRADSGMRAAQESLVRLEDELEEPRKELEQRQKEEAQRKNRIATIQREIDRYKTELENLETVEEIQPKIRDMYHRIREIDQKVREIGEQQSITSREKQPHEDTIRSASDELTQMKDVREQRLMVLRRMNGDAYNAVMWLKDNQDRFKMPILEPVMLSVNIVDKQYVNQVESFLRGKDFMSFVAQNDEDRETFLREIRDKMRLRVNVVGVPEQPLSAFRPSIDMQTLRQYGFKKMMLELVDAPEQVLRFFCRYHGLHQVPIAPDLRPEQLDRIASELGRLRSFFTASERYSMIRSLYRNESSARTTTLKDARVLVASVDSARKQELEGQIQAAHHAMRGFEDSLKELAAREEALRREDATLRHEKNKMRSVLDSRRKMQSNISARQTKLDQLQSSSFNIEEEERECEKKIEAIQQKRVSKLEQLDELMRKMVDSVVARTEASLLVRTAEMRVGYLMTKYRQAKADCERLEQEVQALEYREQTAKQRAKAKLEKARSKSGVHNPTDNPQLMEAFNLLPATLEAIDDSIHENQTQADMCMSTDEGVLREYERREEKIGHLKSEITEISERLETREGTIAELKEKWLATLKQVLASINDKFRRYFSSHTQMECAGEVSLEENADFSKYGVLIRVKFRNSEELQALNAQRQSGGERSVSTMLYLMALQGQASCPFRVVDEINQGMDPVNERHVFNLIVQSAATGSQYFLLTPKLLQHLDYSDVVQIHLVQNGQEMVPYNKWDLKGFLD